MNFQIIFNKIIEKYDKEEKKELKQNQMNYFKR